MLISLTHFWSSMIVFVLLGAQDARLAMQVLATDDFDTKQSVSKVALMRQSVVGCVGAALSELGKDAGSVRRARERTAVSRADRLCAQSRTSGAC